MRCQFEFRVPSSCCITNQRGRSPLVCSHRKPSSIRVVPGVCPHHTPPSMPLCAHGFCFPAPQQRISSCKHMSAYRHTVGSAGFVDSTSGQQLTEPRRREECLDDRWSPSCPNLCSCEQSTPTSILLTFRPKSALPFGLVLCSLSQKHLHPSQL